MIRFLRTMGLASLGGVVGPSACRNSIVICLHSVAVDAPSTQFAPNRELSIRPSFLADVVSTVRDAGLQILPLDELLHRVRSERQGSCAAITFDDGYDDNVALAFPILERLHAPFTVFITPGFLDRTVPMWWVLLEKLIASRNLVMTEGTSLPTESITQKTAAFARLANRFRAAQPEQIIRIADDLIARNSAQTLQIEVRDTAMSWENARRLHRSGLVTVGCHTMSHPTLANLSRDAINTEIRTARNRLRLEINDDPVHFAYPFGSSAEIEPYAAAAVEQEGFLTGWTTRRNLVRKSDLAEPFRLPRVTLDGRYQDRRVVRAYLSGLPFVVRDGIRSWIGQAERKRSHYVPE